ncbi:MAG: hypothetical protein HEP71_19115 [Roseivirga sp.]|nr:hypothetical protein [Roseivirga sp.]
MSKVFGRYIITIALLGCMLGCKEETQPTAFENLLQEGYEIFYSDTLRFDQKEFVAVALKQHNEDSLIEATMDEIARPLLILEKKPDSKFDIALRNDKVILCGACGGMFGDPLDIIEADGKSLTISHHGGSRYRWTRHISFEFLAEQQGWFLSSDKGISYDSMNPEGELEEIEYTSVDTNQPLAFGAFNSSTHYEE